MSKPLALSLIIPAYNEEQHLKKCLDSVAAQTVMPAEVIVVNNNSTDATQSIAASYSFVKVIDESQQGIVFARNAGFDAATQQLLGRIDADTVLPIDWVENIMQIYSTYGSLNMAVTGDCLFTNLAYPKLASKVHAAVYYRLSRILTGREVLFGSNMVITRPIWREVRMDTCVSNKVHEDTDLSVHLPRKVLVRRESNITAQALMRMPLLPHRFWQYVGRWLYTLGHSRASRRAHLEFSE